MIPSPVGSGAVYFESADELAPCKPENCFPVLFSTLTSGYGALRCRSFVPFVLIGTVSWLPSSKLASRVIGLGSLWPLLRGSFTLLTVIYC